MPELTHVAGAIYWASSNFASSGNGHVSVLFDGDNATFWLGTEGAVGNVYVDIGVNKQSVPTSYGVRASNSSFATRTPKDWAFKASKDGIIWDTLDTQTSQTGWSSAELRSYNVSTLNGYRFFWLDIGDNNGDGSFTEFGEFTVNGADTTDQYPTQFAPTNMTAPNSPSPYVASESSFYDSGLFLHKFWMCMDGETTQSTLFAGAPTDYGQIDLGTAAYILGAYEVLVLAEFTRAPKAWTLEGSNDGSDWTVLDTVTNQTGWLGGPRIYACDDVAAAYRYYKINITENNGDGTYTRMDAFRLYEATEEEEPEPGASGRLTPGSQGSPRATEAADRVSNGTPGSPFVRGTYTTTTRRTSGTQGSPTTRNTA